MRVDVPQLSVEVPEGWGTPLLAVAGVVAYGVGWAVAAGLVHRGAVARGVQERSPLDPGDAFLGALWPALLVVEGLHVAALLAWRAGRVPLRPFVALARRVAGDTCPPA